MADYIRRDIVLGIINTVNDTGGFAGYADYCVLFDEIDTMPASDVQPVNRWISVDDALPIYDGLVLAVDKNNTVRLCVYTELGWLSQYGNPIVAHITHWQPLPEPPKDGDTE